MRDDDDQPDLFKAKAARDQGLERARVAAGDWYDQAVAWSRKLTWADPHWRGTGEDLRLQVYEVIGPPQTNSRTPNNVWGAVIRELVRRKYLVATGLRRPMKGEKSNARATDVYRVNR